MTYVDGFVLKVPKKNFKEYKKMASEGAKMWKKFGAIGYYECVNDDLTPNTMGGQILPFKKLTKVKPTEDVWYSFIIYKSKAQRNLINKKIHKEMSEQMKKKENKNFKMPFDTKKMSYGGFKTIVEK